MSLENGEKVPLYLVHNTIKITILLFFFFYSTTARFLFHINTRLTICSCKWFIITVHIVLLKGKNQTQGMNTFRVFRSGRSNEKKHTKTKQRGKRANSTFPAIQDSVMQWEVRAHPTSGTPLQSVIKLHTQVTKGHIVRPQFSALPHIWTKDHVNKRILCMDTELIFQ